MPELKKGSAANALEVFVASPVEPDSIRFKDKTREKQRQQVTRVLVVYVMEREVGALCCWSFVKAWGWRRVY
jgi:hypothetical protein